jgi:serine/threonine protein kinase
VVRPLASGGMGAVYVAEQLSTGRLRALKLMRPELLGSADLRARFEREARLSARIASAHVVEVIAAGADPMPFVAMELLDGADLEAHVEAHGPLAVADARAVLEELCHAVEAAHAAGLVHRDLKPANVFLAHTRRAGGAYTVKVLDFGIAKLLGAATAGTTGALGSPLWMAPEQADDGPVTQRADVWALGLVAFFVFTGRPFWLSARDDASVGRLLREVLFDALPRASERAHELGLGVGCLPLGFDEVFARAVARPVEARYPSVRALWTDLARVLDAATGLSRPQSASSRLPPGQPSGLPPPALASVPPASGLAPTSAEVSSTPWLASAASAAPSQPFVPPDPRERGGPLSATRPIATAGGRLPWSSQKKVLATALVVGAGAWGAVAWVGREPRPPGSASTALSFAASSSAPPAAFELGSAAPLAAQPASPAGEAGALAHSVLPPASSTTPSPTAPHMGRRPLAPAAPVKEGTLPPGVVEGRLRRGMERLSCSQGEPTAESVLTASVDFWIQPDGGVSQVRVSGLPPGYRSCVMSQLARIAYPKPVGGPVHVIVHALRVRLAKAASASAPVSSSPSAPAP